MTLQDGSKDAGQLLAVKQSLSPMQDDGHGHQEIVPSLLTQDTLNPSFYGMRIIATELEALINTLMTKVLLLPRLSDHACKTSLQRDCHHAVHVWVKTPLVTASVA